MNAAAINKNQPYKTDEVKAKHLHSGVKTMPTKTTPIKPTKAKQPDLMVLGNSFMLGNKKVSSLNNPDRC